LQPGGSDHWYQTANVKGIRSWVDTYVSGEWPLRKPPIETGRGVLKEAASRQSFEQFIHGSQWYPLVSSMAIG
jgi:hypothetical protein